MFAVQRRRFLAPFMILLALRAAPAVAHEGENPFTPGQPFQPQFPANQRIIIADPLDGSVLQEEPRRVTVSFRQFEFDLVPGSLELWIDGVEYTESLQFWLDQAWVDLEPGQLNALRIQGGPFHDISARMRDLQNQIWVALARVYVLPVCPGGCPWPFAPTDQPHVVSNLLEDWQDFGGQPYFHSGIDIREPAGTLVGSCTAGTVVKVVNYKSGSLYWEVAVRDPAGFIWQYHHLDPCCILVSEGSPVFQGQALGKVVTWSESMNGYRYDHIHLNVTRWTYAGPVPGPYVDGFVHYNPLRFLTKGSYVDVRPPLNFNLYYAGNESPSVFAAASDPAIPLLSGDVDIVARLEDDMTTIGPPPYGQPYTLGVYDLAYQAKGIDTPCGMGFIPKTRLARFDEMPGGAVVRTQDSLLKLVYRPKVIAASFSTGTVYDYFDQRYFYTMTNTSKGLLDGPGGFWDTDRNDVLGGVYPDGRYEVKVFAKDYYGNETVTTDSVFLNNGSTFRGICSYLIVGWGAQSPYHLKSASGADHAFLPPPVPLSFGPVTEGAAIATVGGQAWPPWVFDLPERNLRVMLGLPQGETVRVEYTPLLGDVVFRWNADVQVLPLAEARAGRAGFDRTRAATSIVPLRMSTRLARDPSTGDALIGTPAAYQSPSFQLVIGRTIDVNGEPMTLLSEDPGGEDCAWQLNPADAPQPTVARPGRVFLNVSPNPFRPGGALRLELERGGELTVEILDLAGRRVRQIFHGELPAGGTSLSWDGRDAVGVRQPGGVYYARAWSGGAQIAKTLVLMR